MSGSRSRALEADGEQERGSGAAGENIFFQKGEGLIVNESGKIFFHGFYTVFLFLDIYERSGEEMRITCGCEWTSAEKSDKVLEEI